MNGSPKTIRTPDQSVPRTIEHDRTSLLSPALLLVCIASFGALVSFYLLLAVVPLFASSVGVNDIGAGLTTGALMIATVLTELVTPMLTEKLGRRTMFIIGLVLLGAPAFGLIGATTMLSILIVCVIRGIGFAIIAVLGSALVAALVPPQRRAEGLGLYGVVVGVPAIAALPVGVWMAAHVGFTAVFVVGALSALLGIAALPGLRDQSVDADSSHPPVRIADVFRSRALAGPAALFSLSAMATGVVVTFLALALPSGSGNIVAAALLANASASTLFRWIAGRHGNRLGSSKLLVQGVIAAAAGTLLIALTFSAIAVVAGMMLLGAGFGIAQNASLSLMYERAPASAYDTVSAVWNIAYDAGLGVGSSCFGVLAAWAGYPAAFVVTSAAMGAALVAARMNRTSTVKR